MLLIASITSMIALGGIVAAGGNLVDTGVFAIKRNGSGAWYHYAAIEATETRPGSREFWTNSSDGCGTHYLEKPAGVDIDSISFMEHPAYYNMSKSDDRYIAPLISSPIYDIDNDVIKYGIYPQSILADEGNIYSTLNSNAVLQDNGWYKYRGEYYAKKNSNWYKCEPIIWEGINTAEGKILLLSQSLLDTKQYDDSDQNYLNSDIRSWLNNGFYNSAFTFGGDELLLIDIDESNKDGITMLSLDDYQNADYGFTNNNSRICSTTEYSGYNGTIDTKKYWTRTQASSHSSYFVDYNGTIDAWTYKDSTEVRVRPAIRLLTSSYIHNLVVTSNNESKGTVNVVGNGFTGEEITLTATALYSNIFLGWFDGESRVSKETTYTFNMPNDDVTLEARFYTAAELEALDYYYLTINKQNSGTANTNVSGYYKAGDSIVLEAADKGPFEFQGWYEGDTKVSSDYSYTCVMPSNSLTITAKFLSYFDLGTYSPASNPSECGTFTFNNDGTGQYYVNSNSWINYTWSFDGNDGYLFCSASEPHLYTGGVYSIFKVGYGTFYIYLSTRNTFSITLYRSSGSQSINMRYTLNQ